MTNKQIPTYFVVCRRVKSATGRPIAGCTVRSSILDPLASTHGGNGDELSPRAAGSSHRRTIRPANVDIVQWTPAGDGDETTTGRSAPETDGRQRADALDEQHLRKSTERKGARTDPNVPRDDQYSRRIQSTTRASDGR